MFCPAPKKDSSESDPFAPSPTDNAPSSSAADNITQTEPSPTVSSTTAPASASATEIPHRPSKLFVFPKLKSGRGIDHVKTSGLNYFRGCIMIRCEYILCFLIKRVIFD